MPVTTRPATARDAAAIARIYNQGIEERVATFETEARTPRQVAGILRQRGAAYPAVVAVDDEAGVVGFAWTSPYSTRPCYAGIGEFSVYVERAARGAGWAGNCSRRWPSSAPDAACGS